MTDKEEKALKSAEGYHDLGMIEDSWEELLSISSRGRNAIPAMNMEAMLLIKESRWDEALEIAQNMCKRAPKQPGGYIHTAFCLHEMGKTQDALDLLLNGPKALENEATYFYNLSCYRAQLSQIEEAESLLRKAIKMDSNLKKTAKEDPDLKEVWPLL